MCDIGLPPTAIQHQAARLGTDAGIPAPILVRDALRTPGQPLAPEARRFFGPLLGYDLGKVRVHNDARAADAARAVSAKAFTVGHHVVFDQGHYSPDTPIGRSLMAHELTHVLQQRGNETVLQRAETDTVPGCAALTDSQTGVDTRVNAALTTARTASGTPVSGSRVAQNVEHELGRDVQTGRTAIEVWAGTLPAAKVSLPAQSATKYAGATYRIWSNPLFPILNPTMKISGICVGSDKLGHFFLQGATYWRTETATGRAAADEQSERSEGGGFGLTTTGVFSNADQEANRQGGRFYRELITRPTMHFAISSYISSRWSEVDNPNFYEDSVGHQVWANLLSGSWSGRSISGTPAVSSTLSVSLAATTAAAITGTFNIGGTTTGTLRGTIRYNTTTVRGTSLFGADTSPTPISGIRIEFDWTLGTESGRGSLDSRGERRLVGGWGRGVSRSDRGTWDIDHS